MNLKKLRELAEAAPKKAKTISEDDYGDELWFGGQGCGLIYVGGWADGGCKQNAEQWKELQADAAYIAAINPQQLIALLDLVELQHEVIQADMSRFDQASYYQMMRNELVGANPLFALEAYDKLNQVEDV